MVSSIDMCHCPWAVAATNKTLFFLVKWIERVIHESLMIQRTDLFLCNLFSQFVFGAPPPYFAICYAYCPLLFHILNLQTTKTTDDPLHIDQAHRYQ
jgi:hypothetical protein